MLAVKNGWSSVADVAGVGVELEESGFLAWSHSSYEKRLKKKKKTRGSACSEEHRPWELTHFDSQIDSLWLGIPLIAWKMVTILGSESPQRKQAPLPKVADSRKDTWWQKPACCFWWKATSKIASCTNQQRLCLSLSLSLSWSKLSKDVRKKKNGSTPSKNS